MTQRIYVACLAAYNNGILHGRWIDASTDKGEMLKQIAAMLSESPYPGAEEWAIHDHEGLGDLKDVNDLDAVARRMAVIARADDQDIPFEVLTQFVDEYCPDAGVTEIDEEIDDRYSGHFTEAADWAYDEAESGGFMVPDWLRPYIDWDGVARDWLMDYAQYAHGGETYIFRA